MFAERKRYKISVSLRSPRSLREINSYLASIIEKLHQLEAFLVHVLNETGLRFRRWTKIRRLDHYKRSTSLKYQFYPRHYRRIWVYAIRRYCRTLKINIPRGKAWRLLRASLRVKPSFKPARPLLMIGGQFSINISFQCPDLQSEHASFPIPNSHPPPPGADSGLCDPTQSERASFRLRKKLLTF